MTGSVRRAKARISSILDDRSLDHDQRVARLVRMHEDARDEQRAATESGMGIDNGEAGETMRQVEIALDRIGSGADDIPSKGAASL
ncbi:MAG: hypothetical protein R3D02_10255 [Hyphomicrobiales bacterium]